ncbi:MAG: sugar ABC transporter substrate-binding protein [Chloroflexota bacterium]|nr:sugar ABC transporter substrate-binding protein [Chloroflexota bacterium]
MKRMLVVVAALMSCLPHYFHPPTVSQDAPAGAIRFGFWGDPAEAAAYETMVDVFTTVHPEIAVQTEYVADGDDFYARLATSYAAGDAPDVFLINYRRYGQFAAAGALEPIAPYLDQSAVIAADDYYPAPMAAFTFEGELMCLPQNLSSLVVYYNHGLFDAAAIAYPAADWSWDDFLAAALALSQDTDGDGRTDQFGAGIEPSLVRVTPFIWQAGGELVDDLDQPTTLMIDTPAARTGMQFVLDLSLVHRVVPSESDVLAQSLEDRFMAGNIAMLLQSRRVVPALRQIADFTWDVAPLPRREETAGILHSDAYCLSAGSKSKAAAWTFIEFANGPDGQAIVAEVGRTVPSLRAIAESPIFLGPNGVVVTGAASDAATLPASAHVFLDAEPDLRRLPATATWPEVEQAFNEEFSLAFYGKQLLDEAIAAILDRTAEPLRRES